MLPEAILHGLEIVDALHPLGIFLREDKAAECGFELLSACSVCHPAETGTVPVDLAGLFVESALLRGFFFCVIEGGDLGTLNGAV